MIFIDKNLIDRVHKEGLEIQEFLYLYSLWKDLDWNINSYSNGQYLHEIETITKERINSLKKILRGDFLEFWETFPASDHHSLWKKTRVLKTSLNGSYEKYYKLIDKGASHEEIMKGLRNEIKWRRENSKLDNKMKFMKNSQSWLHNMVYKDWLDKPQENGLEDKTTIL